MLLVDSVALWKLGLCAGHAGMKSHAGNRRRDITAHLASEFAERSLVTLKMVLAS
jgi:hypothetical protein